MEKWKIPLDSLPWTTSNKHSIKNSSTVDVVLQQKNNTDALFIESIYLCVADEMKTKKKVIELRITRNVTILKKNEHHYNYIS